MKSHFWTKLVKWLTLQFLNLSIFTRACPIVQIKKNEGQIDRILTLPPWILEVFFFCCYSPNTKDMSMLCMYLNPLLYCKFIMGRGKFDLPYISCTTQCLEQNRTQKVTI